MSAAHVGVSLRLDGTAGGWASSRQLGLESFPILEISEFRSFSSEKVAGSRLQKLGLETRNH